MLYCHCHCVNGQRNIHVYPESCEPVMSILEHQQTEATNTRVIIPNIRSAANCIKFGCIPPNNDHDTPLAAPILQGEGGAGSGGCGCFRQYQQPTCQRSIAVANDANHTHGTPAAEPCFSWSVHHHHNAATNTSKSRDAANTTNCLGKCTTAASCVASYGATAMYGLLEWRWQCATTVTELWCQLEQW